MKRPLVKILIASVAFSLFTGAAATRGSAAPSGDVVAQGAPMLFGAVAPCSGGTITRAGSTFVHKFSSSGSFACSISKLIRRLVGAGGAGGAGNNSASSGFSGGAGAGGVRIAAFTMPRSTACTITIGAKGTGSTGAAVGNAGSNTTVTGCATVTSIGGGYSSYIQSPGAGSGGSGGGGGSDTGGVGSGAAGTAGEGNAGGNSGTAGNSGGGGGGGCQNAGANAVVGQGGVGGAGCSDSITGKSECYGGGGGAAGGYSGGAAGGPGCPGAGTGGNSVNGNATSADNALGGCSHGGGGASAQGSGNKTGGDGSDGCVIFSYNATLAEIIEYEIKTRLATMIETVVPSAFAQQAVGYFAILADDGRVERVIVATETFVQNNFPRYRRADSGGRRANVNDNWTGNDFRPSKPFPSWKWNLVEKTWESPVPLPANDNFFHVWNEAAGQWDSGRPRAAAAGR